MRAMQITEHVHALRIPFQIKLGSGAVDRFVYSFIISGEDLCLIDTGVAGSEKLIFDYIRRIGKRPEDISMVIQTHSHPDHIGATRAIKEATGCMVAAHPAEKAWIEDVDRQAKERPVPGFHSLVGGSIVVDRELNDGEVLNGLRLEVLHTPGHSQGSISLLTSEGELFSGDAIPVLNDLPIYEDVKASVDSVKKLKQVQGVRTLLSSWDRPREGEQAYQAMDEGLNYLQTVHKTVLDTSKAEPNLDPMELSKRVLQKLGVHAPPNPLFVKSILANLALRDESNLI